MKTRHLAVVKMTSGCVCCQGLISFFAYLTLKVGALENASAGFNASVSCNVMNPVTKGPINKTMDST